MGKRVQQFDTAATALCILLSAGVLVLGIMSLIGHTLRHAWLMLAFGAAFYLIKALSKWIHRKAHFRIRGLLLFLLALLCAGGAYLAKLSL